MREERTSGRRLRNVESELFIGSGCGGGHNVHVDTVFFPSNVQTMYKTQFSQYNTANCSCSSKLLSIQ